MIKYELFLITIYQYVENYTLILDEYTVNVAESVKNTQIAEVITVRQPTISTPRRVFPFADL